MSTQDSQLQRQQSRIEDAGIFPKVILIDTISYCNLKCSMCVHDQMTRPKGIMPWSLFTKIIDEIAAENKNARVWMVFFGEALILKKGKPSIFDMIRYAKDKGLTDVVLNSNALLLDEEASRRLISSGLDALYIGLDAFKEETYSKIRVGGDYNKTTKNILLMIELQRKMKASYPRIFVQFVEMDLNKDEKNDFIDFWQRQGVIVKIRPKVSWAGSIEAPNLILNNQQRWPCHWAMQTMAITDRGKVVLCAVDLNAQLVAGDINDQTIKDVWNGKLKNIRRLHEAKRFSELPDFCQECRDWQLARADYYTVNT